MISAQPVEVWGIPADKRSLRDAEAVFEANASETYRRGNEHNHSSLDVRIALARGRKP